MDSAADAIRWVSTTVISRPRGKQSPHLIRAVVALAAILVMTGALARRMHFVGLAAEQGRHVEDAAGQRDRWVNMSLDDCGRHRAMIQSGLTRITIRQNPTVGEPHLVRFDAESPADKVEQFERAMDAAGDVVEGFRAEMLRYWQGEVDRELARQRAIARRWLW